MTIEGDEGNVGDPQLPPESHEVSKHGSEEGRGGADGLVERDREVAERDAAADDGAAEHKVEGGDLEELEAQPDELHGHDVDFLSQATAT